MQCDDCKKQFTPHTWGAVVQVRQFVDHKKTFFLLEQLLLKHNLHDRVLKITQQENGIDFYYKTITHAERLIDFLHTVLPITVKKSKQLTSQDFRNNLVHYKYTFIVQLPLVCRHDLVILPHKVAKNIGGCSRLLLCWKISQNMGFIDLDNFNYITMSPVQYQHYENQMQILPFNRYKSQFQILNCDTIHLKNQQKIKSTLNKLMNKMYYYNVTRSDNWQNIEVKGILGNLNCGKAVQGYDLRYLCYSENLQELKGFQQIILVRTTRDRKQPRIFKLKKLQEEGIMVDEKESFPNRKKKNQSHKDEELQNFMDDLQQDANLRKGVKMYKNQNALKNMNADQLKQVLGELQLCQLITDMKIDPNHDNEKYLNEIDGVEELISKMQKVVIENQEENPQEQQQKPK